MGKVDRIRELEILQQANWVSGGDPDSFGWSQSCHISLYVAGHQANCLSVAIEGIPAYMTSQDWESRRKGVTSLFAVRHRPEESSETLPPVGEGGFNRKVNEKRKVFTGPEMDGVAILPEQSWHAKAWESKGYHRQPPLRCASPQKLSSAINTSSNRLGKPIRFGSKSMAALRDRLEFEPANPGAKPRYDTVLKLLPALGVDLHATATHARGRWYLSLDPAPEERVQMPITVVQLGSPRHPDEGLRIGTVRRPPRGVPKSEFATRDYYDVWLPTLAPTQQLLTFVQQAAQDVRAWKQFERKFTAEMNQSDASRLLDLLAALSHQTNFSVGCYCEDEDRCHRSILRKLFALRGASFSEEGWQMTKVGDQVRHRDGGPEMIIESLAGNAAICTWSDPDGQQHSGTFVLADLEPVTPKDHSAPWTALPPRPTGRRGNPLIVGAQRVDRVWPFFAFDEPRPPLRLLSLWPRPLPRPWLPPPPWLWLSAGPRLRFQSWASAIWHRDGIPERNRTSERTRKKPRSGSGEFTNERWDAGLAAKVVT
jgi:uncharacterized protein YeaO (DUF488 family)/uncharacterized protein YodC (DUF2158 family)